LALGCVLYLVQDISIVGYDNKEISDYLHPCLTTSEIQLREIGKKSAEIMVQILKEEGEGKIDPTTLKAPCKLIERESVTTLS